MQLAFSRLPAALQQTLIYALALALSKAFSLLMVPVATHYLTPADYGRLDILQTLADLLGIVIGMGLTEVMFRFAGAQQQPAERQHIAANVLGLALILALIALVVTQLLAGQISHWLPGDITELECRVLLASLALSNLILVPLAWLQMQGKALHYLLGTAGRTGLQVGLGVLLLMVGFGVSAVLMAGLIAAAVGALWLLQQQWRDTGIRFDWLQFKAFSGYGGPLIFAGMAGFVLGSFDRWILAEHIGTAQMALYALAAKLGLVTAVLIQPFDLWWHARRFTLLEQPQGPVRCARRSEIGLVIALLSALVVAALGPWLIFWLTPAAYHGAMQFVPWLTGLAALHNINNTLGLGAMSQQHTRWPALIDMVAAVIALAGYLWLIPHYGSWGAITATALALSLRALATLYISQWIRPLPWRLRRITLLLGLTTAALALMPRQADAGELPIAAVLTLLVLLAAFGLRLLPVRSEHIDR
ncbi:MAG: oligosaccharide flippase family protein [Marinobacterium sp.]|nr:oligosaccharide flippase family protein [Marinobacterium sp.]